MSFLRLRRQHEARLELLELQRLTQAIGGGLLTTRADVEAATGDARALLSAVNELLDAALLPIGEGNRILDQIAHGKVDELIVQTYQRRPREDEAERQRHRASCCRSSRPNWAS